MPDKIQERVLTTSNRALGLKGEARKNNYCPDYSAELNLDWVQQHKLISINYSPNLTGGVIYPMITNLLNLG